RMRYLFDRVWVFAVLAAVLFLVSFVILALPYNDTYLNFSGAPGSYMAAFVALAILSTCVFIVGMFYNVMTWMEGTLEGVDNDLPRGGKLAISARRFARAILSRDFARQFKIFVSDSIFLRKLWRTSKARWLFHAFILFGVLGIFVLDIIVTLAVDVFPTFGSMFETGSSSAVKYWVRDFGFDFFGLILLIGLIAAAGRRFVARPKQLVTGSEDIVSILFLLAVVLSGFIVEGVSIANGLPGHTFNQGYSFVGLAFAQFMPIITPQIYWQIWFLHAIVSVALIAYIPFSKLFHIFAAPLAIQVEGIVNKDGGS
ncbi:MAG TPA: respiratory nitrate reductase subunit gamma, partial [Thermoplasmata archaeon]|nr:respiratory nitrate reductase subunit gamma [Thermoplasmata archaeon]